LSQQTQTQEQVSAKAILACYISKAPPLKPLNV